VNGREREIRLIRRANRASALGRLMLGELTSWQEFFDADVLDLGSMPRRNLKSGKHDIQSRLSDEIKGFCEKNFVHMTEAKLEDLYKAVKERRGLEIPLPNFQNQYSKIRPHVLKDIPPYSTVVISLWGLNFRYPEYFISDDIRQSLALALEAKVELNKLENISHKEALERRGEISALTQKEGLANRFAILSCYNLLEAYLNGLAWIFALDKEKMKALSNNSRKLIEDSAKLKEKVIKYPGIIAGRTLWGEDDDPPNLLLSDFKHFRDSIVHPSPFSVPERFGGYDKLQNFYMVNIGLSMVIARHTIDAISSIHQHVNAVNYAIPTWLDELAKALSTYEKDFESLVGID
jgi:hypothetical protein